MFFGFFVAQINQVLWRTHTIWCIANALKLSVTDSSYILLALCWLCHQNYCRSAGVRRPSVNSAFLETSTWIQAKLCEKLPIYHISRQFFFFLQNFQFFKFLWFLIALFDYISRAYIIEIRPSPVRPSTRLSFVRLAIFSVPNARISFKF